MAFGSSPPEISISFAPQPEPVVEPFSPFSGPFCSIKDDPSSYRPLHLTPPSSSIKFPRQLSPLRPVETVTEGAGLQRERFEAMLKASRERQSAIAAKRDSGLLKEIALKTHKNKQIERRALFLSKVLAPPSPTATSLPKTPPDSPAIFHYSLPSPGLASPLSLFETLDSPDAQPLPKTTWVEQVDFKLPQSAPRKATSPAQKKEQPKLGTGPLPSLAQISAHLHHRAFGKPENQVNRLPAFLNAPKRLPSPPGERPRLATGVGRLSMPVREPQPIKATNEALLPPPLTPTSPLTPKLQVTTMLVPHTAATSPTQLTEINLLSFNSREHHAKNMLSTIRKRQSVPSECAFNGHDSEFAMAGLRSMKRKSAPGDLGSIRRQIWGEQTPFMGGF